MFGVVADDPTRLLPAVLQCVQAKRHEVRCIGHADDAENPALLLQLVVIEGVRAEGSHASESYLGLRPAV